MRVYSNHPVRSAVLWTQVGAETAGRTGQTQDTMAELQVLLVIHVGNVGEEKEKFHHELGEIKSVGKTHLHLDLLWRWLTD